MRKPMIWLGALVLAVAVQAQDFTRTMTAEEQAAAGLEKLSPAELAKLKAAVERYKAGAVAVVQEQAEQKVAATEAKVKAAEQKVAAAEEKAKDAAAQTSPQKSGPSWLRALVTLKKAEENPSGSEPLESRIAGDFRGWRHGTIFELENGQRWQHVEGADYVTPPVRAPRVKITPGVFGTFWMKIEGVNARVRVKPVKLE